MIEDVLREEGYEAVRWPGHQSPGRAVILVSKKKIFLHSRLAELILVVVDGDDQEISFRGPTARDEEAVEDIVLGRLFPDA